MRHAEEVRRHLALNEATGTALLGNYDLLQSLMANGSIGVGSATSAWARHLNEVAQTLEEIERLHQRLKDGGLDRAAFIQQRQAVFRRLEVQLQGAARLGTGLQGMRKGLAILRRRQSGWAKGLTWDWRWTSAWRVWRSRRRV